MNPTEWYVCTPDLYRKYYCKLDRRGVSTSMHPRTHLVRRLDPVHACPTVL